MANRSQVIDLSDLPPKTGDLGVEFVDAEIVAEAVRTLVNCDVLGQNLKIGFDMQTGSFDSRELDELVVNCKITSAQRDVFVEKAPAVARFLTEQLKKDPRDKTEKVAALARQIWFKEAELAELKVELDRIFSEDRSPKK